MKRWANIINGSASLQHKMFLRPRDQPELWILDRKYKVGANYHSAKYAHLNDTELRFRRVKIPPDDSKSITPITLNPMLRHYDFWMTNILKMATGGETEQVAYSGRTHAFWNAGSFAASTACHSLRSNPSTDEARIQRKD